MGVRDAAGRQPAEVLEDALFQVKRVIVGQERVIGLARHKRSIRRQAAIRIARERLEEPRRRKRQRAVRGKPPVDSWACHLRDIEHPGFV